MPNTPDPQAAKAEALLLRFAAEAHRRKWSYDRGLDDDGVPVKSEAFDALHRLGEEMRTALEELRRTPAVVPSAAETTNQAALLRWAAEQLLASDLGPRPGHTEDYGNGWSDATLRAQSYLLGLAQIANEAEFAATPCSPVVPCEDGGEPCDVHERLLGHYDDSHELCAPDCGTADGPSRVAAEEQPAETQDSLPCWLYQRFMPDGVGWENLDADDRSYWEHHARAVRRAVARGGFKAERPAVGEQPDTQTREAVEDPARIDRIRPEFTEHASIESIDVQLRRARAQERRWHVRVEWLISLRQARVRQKESGEWPGTQEANPPDEPAP
ncbi:hypothetical protein QA811_02140 [Streptomyces sp. B21-102]|uniref:hypothetical protein n=1 Tax=Streptomyces sp. B21-102 TaxID=3039416 RepID=UPI002FF00370